MIVPENERVVRRIVAAWNEEDWNTIERHFDPDCEMVAPEGWPEAGTFRGWPAIRRQYERLKEAWSDERIEVLDLETSGDKALLHQSWLVQGGESGLDMDLETWVIYDFAGGKITRQEFSRDERQARRNFAAPAR